MANGSYIWTAVYEVKTTGDTVILACGRSEDWTEGVVEDIFYNGVSIKTAVTTTYDVVDDMDGNPNVMYRFPTTGLQEVQLLINSEKLMRWSTNSESVFSNTRTLVSIDIPDEVTKIPECCFRWCSKLSAVTFSENMTVIPGSCFDCTNFNCFVIPDNILSASCPTEAAFSLGSGYNKLEYVTLGQSLQFIGFSNAHAQHFKAFYCKPTVCPTTYFYAGHPQNVILYYPYRSNYSAFDAAYPNNYAYVPLRTFPSDTCSYYVRPSGSTSGDTSGSTSGDTSGSTSGDTSGSTSGDTSGTTIGSGGTSSSITYSGCPLVFDHSASTGTWNTLPTVTTAGTTDNWSLTYDVPANDTDSARTITYYYLRYSGETCEDLVDTVSYTISQNAGSGSTPGTTPDPWSDTGDTAYTWYKDDSLLRVLPPSRVLSYDEETAYWPVTAHTFDNVGVRASGDVVFNYELIADGSAEYNSHSLYAHTQNNTGTTQQVSTIKLVAFSGSSAYSASTVLMKNPDSHGWITASPNPVNGASSQNSVNVYLTLTNCERNISKETTDNAEFDAATWVSVSRVNNTALTFNFQANYSNQARSTYYYAYGLDSSGNNVYCRIDITQEANSMGITITPDRTSLGKPAGSFTARVESTESGNFSFSAASWMVVRSYVPESQKAGTLYVDYYENTGNYTRVGDITVSQQISTAPYILTARTQISQNSTADTAYIRVTPSSISVDRTAGVVEAQVSYAGLATVPALVQNEGNMSIVSYNLDSGLITVAYGANDTSMDKYKNFTVTAMSSNGNVIEANFTITQGGTGLPVAPIWRDYVITVPTPGQGYINYNINYDGAVVYTGRAYGMGQDNIEIYYNHLCKPFLSNHIDFTEGYQSIRDWLGNFIITSPELGDITSVSFYEDYSYVNRDITNVMSLNNPIINEVVEGSYVPFSFFITGTSGNVSIMQNGQQITGLTVNDNEQHRYFVEAEKGKTYSSLGAVYKTIPVCSARYSLYYVNSYGGVDVLPFKGKSFKKTDNITRLNYSRSFRNNTLEFENVNYMNEMKPAWELNTSYMVDSQSRKMHELVESTCVYLYDAEEQTYTPVVMTDKKLEYKTFYNQGRRFYTYTINVEESQSKERR